MVVRFAGSHIVKSSHTPKVSVEKGRHVGSGKLADHSDLLQVQDLVSITHHAFDRKRKEKKKLLDSQIAIIKTHRLSPFVLHTQRVAEFLLGK